MALPYEILIRSTDGKYSGAQVLDTPTSQARAITDKDWPAIVKDINKEATAALQAAKLDSNAKIKEAEDKSAKELAKANESAAKDLADSKAESATTIAKLQAEIDTLKISAAEHEKEMEAGKALLIEHQRISDGLATQAEEAFAAGNTDKIKDIIAEAKLFGNAREKKKILEEAEALEKQAGSLEDKALELREKANKL